MECVKLFNAVSNLTYELIFERTPQLKDSSIKLLTALNNLTHSKVISYNYHTRKVTLKCNTHGVIYSNRPERILDYSRCPLCKSITISTNTKKAMQRPEVYEKVNSENKSLAHKIRFSGNKHKGVTLVPTTTEQNVMDFLVNLGFIWNYQTNCPQGYYKSDFINLEHKLIIELDGSYHNAVSQSKLDKEKDNFFKDLGYKTFRFSNRYISTHRDFFEQIVLTYIEGGGDLYDRLYIK